MLFFLIFEKFSDFNSIIFNHCVQGKWKLSGIGFRKPTYEVEIKESNSNLKIHYQNSKNRGDILLNYNSKNQSYNVFYKSKQIAVTSFGLEPKCSFYTKSFESYQNYSFIFDYAYEKGKFYFSNEPNQQFITFQFKKHVKNSYHSILVQFFFGTVCIYFTFKASPFGNQKDKTKTIIDH